jgi:aspartyl-tRNA(Asn)/glutamyl-tRNA(Gln) amidotransferase subunit B
VIEGVTGPWELVIGLEVHAQIATQAKLFSGASTLVGAEPNSQVSFIDAGMPGMLPVVNEGCLAQAVRTGLGLKARINLRSAFDRKNYFYPDLPQGYQISQLYAPLVGEGEVLVEVGGATRIVRIERIHVEQDAGKSVHDMDPVLSFVDLNRTGVALMEIVSRPDIRGPEEAAAYVAKLRQILRYLGTLRRRHAAREPAGRRERVGLPPRRLRGVPSGRRLGPRHALRDQEHELAAVHPSGDRRRGAPPDRRSSRTAARRARKRASTTPTGARRGPCAPRRRRTTTATSPTPTSCRWRSSRPGSTTWPPPARAARRQEGPLRAASFGLSDYDASVLTADTADAAFFEAWRRAATARWPRTGSSTTFSAASRRMGASCQRAPSRPRSSARSST